MNIYINIGVPCQIIALVAYFKDEGKYVIAMERINYKYTNTAEENQEILDSKSKELIKNVIKSMESIKTGESIEGTRTDVGDFTDVLKNITYYKPGNLDKNTSEKIGGKISKILTAVTNIGMMIAISILAVLGVKYMLGSVEEKAEYKKDLLPYLIGAILLFGIVTFMKIFMQFGQKISN